MAKSQAAHSLENQFTALIFLSITAVSTRAALKAAAHSMQVVCAATACFHILLAYFAFRRSQAVLVTNTKRLLSCLPSLCFGALVWHVATLETLNIWQLGIFSFSYIFAICSLLSLNTSFAVLPSLRVIKTGGLYNVVRHPMYLGEIVMAGSLAVTAGYIGALVMAGLLITIVVRINVEEQLLSVSPQYREYAQKVRYRLIPYLW